MSSAIRRGKITRADLALWDGKTPTYSRTDATGGTTAGLVIGDSVDVLQVFGAGASRSRASISAAAQYIGTAKSTLMLAPGTWSIDDNLTIASNLSVRIPAGCVIDVASGKTLTINGPVFNDAAVWTSGSGSVAVFGGIFGPEITTAEIAAGVTPINYAYPECNVLRYGNNAVPGTTDMTAVIQTALSVANIGASPTAGNRQVYVPAGLYFIGSISVPDFVTLRGAGRWETIFTGTLTNASYFRSKYGESPTIGQRPVGIDLMDFSLQCDSIGAGSVGINLKNAQLTTVRDVVIKNVDTGAVTDQITQYQTWDNFIVQTSNTAASFASVGGGNSLIACRLAANVVALDINGGAWDIIGGTYEANVATATYLVRVGRPGGQTTYVKGFGLYVEAPDPGGGPRPIALQVENSVIGSYIVLDRHSFAGAIVNNAGEECHIIARGHFDPLVAAQVVAFCNTIDGPEQASFRTVAGNSMELRNGTRNGYADLTMRSLFLIDGSAGISARNDGNVPNVLRGQVQFTAGQTSHAITFATAQTFSGYYVLTGVIDDSGASATSHQPFISSQTVNGFTLNTGDPGGGKSVIINWLIVG